MLHIITTCNDINRLVYLRENDKLINGKISIKYIIFPLWTGYHLKLFHTRQYILDNNLADDDIVCFIDAYDVLTFATSEEIVEKFKKYNTQLLIGAENNCYPDNYINTYNEINANKDIVALTEIKKGDDTLGNSNFLYVNSGGYIGYKNAVLDMLTWKPDNNIIEITKREGDQSYLHEYFIANWNNLEKVKLDYGQEIFLNSHLVSWKELYFQNGRLVNSTLKNTPCFIHFHGSSWLLEDYKSAIPLFLNALKTSISLKNNNNLDIVSLSDLKQRHKNLRMQLRNIL
jgi:hypothetical protein